MKIPHTYAISTNQFETGVRSFPAILYLDMAILNLNTFPLHFSIEQSSAASRLKGDF